MRKEKYPKNIKFIFPIILHVNPIMLFYSNEISSVIENGKWLRKNVLAFINIKAWDESVSM